MGLYRSHIDIDIGIGVSPSFKMEKIVKDLVSHRTADQLSLHHDSQFLDFSIEVVNQTNQKHNHSSSLCTALAEQTECKVANTGAGQTNY